MQIGGALPGPHEASLMLDMDGTLLDIAPTPAEVIVAPGLPAALLGLRDALGGALAIVTGRPIEQVDTLFPGIPHAVAGEHGGAIRHAPGMATVRAPLPAPPTGWMIEAQRIVDAHAGATLERKQRGFVVHFRAVPWEGPALRAAVEGLIGPLADQFHLMEALMAWEVRPRGADKGSAVHALAGAAPFAGRKPIFIGDDVTDEDGMAAARAMGGAGFRVDAAFGGPRDVRAWLAASAAALGRGEDWPPLPRPLPL